MPIDPEAATNLIPQYTNFGIRFSPITQDGSSFNFNTVQGWIFMMGRQFPVPQVSKSSTGTASGDFIISSGTATITVNVRASEIANGYGTFYVSLQPFASGRTIGHTQKWITIQQGFQPSGV